MKKRIGSSASYSGAVLYAAADGSDGGGERGRMGRQCC